MFVLLSLLALSPMFGRDGVGVDKLGIILIILFALIVLIFGSLSLDIVIIVIIILFLFILLVVIILISLQNIMERGSYMDAQSGPVKVGGSFNPNSLLNWSRGSPEPKSGVSGSLHLAVPDPEAEFFPDLAMSVNRMLPMRHPWELQMVC